MREYLIAGHGLRHVHQVSPGSDHGCLSWAAGTPVCFLTFFKVFTFTTAPALDSIIVAAVVHFVLMLITGNKVAVPKKA